MRDEFDSDEWDQTIVYPFDKFYDYCKHDEFTDDDGIGLLIDINTEETGETVSPSQIVSIDFARPERFTHIKWFPK